MEERVGDGFGWLAIVNTKFAVVPPPGVGFVTVMLAGPTVVMSLDRIDAVSWVELTKVVVFALPLNFTMEVDTKPVPFTVRVKPAPPAVAPFGLSKVIAGAGLLTVNV